MKKNKININGNKRYIQKLNERNWEIFILDEWFEH